MELEKLMGEITQRIADLKGDFTVDVDSKELLINENTKILLRCQQLHLKSDLFCEKVNRNGPRS